MGKFGLEQTSPILHNLKPLALSKAVRDSLGELGGRGGTFLGRWGWRGCLFWMLLNGAEITPACAAAKLRAFSFLLRLEFYSYSGSFGLWKLFFPSYTDTILLLTKSLWANCCCRNTCCNRTACPHFLSSWLFLRCAGKHLPWGFALALLPTWSALPPGILWISSSLSDLSSEVSFSVSFPDSSFKSTTLSLPSRHSSLPVIVYFSP